MGFSLKRGAVQRWILTAHYRAPFVDKCRDLAYMKESERRVHKEGAKFRIQKDEECVKQMIEVIQNWRNPFEDSDSEFWLNRK